MDEYRTIVKCFYEEQYRLLKCFALWELSPTIPKRLRKLYNLYFWYSLIFWMLLFHAIMVLQVIINISDIDKVIKVFFMLPTAIGVLGKYLNIKIKNKSYENLFKLMFNNKYLPKNHYERKIFEKCVKLNKQVRNYYACHSFTALSTLFMTQYLSAAKELPVNIYKPELNTNWKYNLMYIYQCFSLAVLCLVNVAFDSLATAFFIHLKSQLNILAYRLENIGLQPNNSQDCVLKELKDCLRYYNRILLLSHDIEYLVSIPISLQIACSVFVLIANFYVMSLLSFPEDMTELIKNILYQTCMLSQIFIMCYFSNEVSLKSSEISFNLYSSNWYNWNKINRKLVLLMMIRFEIPIRIKTINRCYSFNLATFTSIVNSSYSYFALLKRFNV